MTAVQSPRAGGLLPEHRRPVVDHEEDIIDSRELNWRIVNASNSSGSDPEPILEVVGQSLSGFNVVNCVTAAQRIYKAAKPSGGVDRSKMVVADPRWQDLQERLRLFLTDQVVPGAEPVPLTPHHYSLSLTAFVSLQIDNPQLLREVGYAATRRMHEFQPQHLANTVFSFASAGVDSEEIFRAIENACYPKLRSFKPQDFANTLWGFERVRFNASKEFLTAAWEAASARLNKFAAQELATMARAYAALGPHGVGNFFAMLLAECVEKLPKFGKPAFLKLACAVSRVSDGAANEQVFAAFGQKAMTQVGDYSVDELRVLGQALSKIKTRLLRKHGMRAVPAFTWDRDNQSREECMEYLRALLEPVSRDTSKSAARPKQVAAEGKLSDDQSGVSSASAAWASTCKDRTAKSTTVSKTKTRELEERPAIRTVRADFVGADSVQLSVSTGMRVLVHRVHPSGWAYGVLDSGEAGWFPKDVLREARDDDDPSDCASTVDTTTSPSERETAANTPERDTIAASVGVHSDDLVVRATHDFLPPTTEHHQLELQIGRTYAIVQEDPSGWSYGRCMITHKAGWFPRSMTVPV